MIIKKKLGRPTIGSKAMTEAQIRERFAEKLRDSGGRTLTCRLKNPAHVKILRKFANESPKDFRSETAAATFILEQALINLGRRMSYAETNSQ